MSKEAINHPSQYGGDVVYETIKVMEAKLTPDEFRGAMKFQVAKYLDRGGKKDGEPRLKDQQKAAWYANYLVDFEVRLAAGQTGEARVPLLIAAQSAAQAVKKVRR